ncbi:MAG: PINc/VapC family ATPase [Desulfurococcaceae archaeon]
MKIAGEQVYLPDFSAIVSGAVSKLVRYQKIQGRVVVHKGLVQILELMASKGRGIAHAGLEELRTLRTLHSNGIITMEYTGGSFKIRGDEEEEYLVSQLNTEIRELALSTGGVLITSDIVAYEISRALGIEGELVEKEEKTKLMFEEYIDSETMSIHFKEGSFIVAKKGKPGEWRYVKISQDVITRSYVEKLASEILEEARRRSDAFIEIDRAGSTIIQLGEYRIIIVRPPLSDGWELTIVKPLKKLRLEDYNLPEELIRRLNERAEGILIAGAPGMGKTTFAQALAEYYFRSGKIVKTVESPRDMILPSSITQYSKHYATIGELHDILLLSRPDYTVFDEMRTDEDFKLYTDLRLAGIGMIGVVHATSPIDAIQRFIGRVDLGMIPSIIDTVVFIKNGRVEKVYDVRMTVKLPTGLREAELSRPVVEVRDFLTGELEYEIYTFGEQTVVVPVRKLRERGDKWGVLLERIKYMLPGVEVKTSEDGVILEMTKEMLKKYRRKISRIRKLCEKEGAQIRVVFREE